MCYHASIIYPKPGRQFLLCLCQNTWYLFNRYFYCCIKCSRVVTWARVATYNKVTLTHISQDIHFFIIIKNSIEKIEYVANSDQIVWFLITIAEYFYFGNKIFIYYGYLTYSRCITYKINNSRWKKEHQQNTRLLNNYWLKDRRQRHNSHTSDTITTKHIMSPNTKYMF